jgi:cytidylate kinase
MNLDTADIIGLCGSAAALFALDSSELCRGVSRNCLGGNRAFRADTRALAPADASYMIIAVDGPAASGKGTIGRALANHYGLPHLDTGLLYRAVGIAVMRHGADPESAIDALNACDFSAAMLSDPEIRSEAASRAASAVSVHREVRAALMERQRAFAQQPGGAVLDGRDIGTVIAPEADAKLFVTASSAARAARRFAELTSHGAHVLLDHVLHDIEARDARDSGRSVAPLLLAPDADLLDTTNLTIDDAVRQAISLVEAQVKP